MRKLLAASVLVLCSLFIGSLSIHAQKTRGQQKTRLGQALSYAKPGVDYPLKVHVSSLHYREEYLEDETAANRISIDTVIDGRKVELTGDEPVAPFQVVEIPLGDLQARFIGSPKKNIQNTPLFQQYEIVLPDRHIWRCTVTGLSE